MDFDHQFTTSKVVNRYYSFDDERFFKWDTKFLELAKLISTWSKDPSSQIGAVAIDPNTRRILSTGYNGFPRGVDDTEERLNNREKKYSLIVHAEQNVIYNATLNGVSLSGSTIYISGLPTCSECAKGIIQVGIKRVVCSFPKDLDEKWQKSFEKSIDMYKEAGVEIYTYKE